MEPAVGRVPLGQRAAALPREVGAGGGQPRVLLTLDQLAILARQSGLRALAHRSARRPSMAHDGELVEEDGDLGNLLQRGVLNLTRSS